MNPTILERIIARVRAFIRKLFRRDSVDGITGVFEKTSRRLITLSDEKMGEAAGNEFIATVARNKAREARAEAEKAHLVAGKISALLSK